jgi:hypothetical protein
VKILYRPAAVIGDRPLKALRLPLGFSGDA